MNEFDRVPLRWLTPALVLLCLATTGCQKDLRDMSDVDRAMSITRNLEEGAFVMRQAGDYSNDLDNFALTIAQFEEAREHFKTAYELDRASGGAPSAKPRFALGNNLHATAILYWRRFEARQVKANLARESGADATALQTAADADRAAAQDFARQSNDVLIFYYQYLYPAQPNAMVLEMIARNCEFTDQWMDAARYMKLFVQAVGMRPGTQQRLHYESLIRGYEERGLQAVDEGY